MEILLSRKYFCDKLFHTTSEKCEYWEDMYLKRYFRKCFGDFTVSVPFKRKFEEIVF